jgi:hypothetical protein
MCYGMAVMHETQSKRAPMTGAERQRRYRARVRADAAWDAEFRMRDSERNRRYREKLHHRRRPPKLLFIDSRPSRSRLWFWSEDRPVHSDRRTTSSLLRRATSTIHPDPEGRRSAVGSCSLEGFPEQTRAEKGRAYWSREARPARRAKPDWSLAWWTASRSRMRWLPKWLTVEQLEYRLDRKLDAPERRRAEAAAEAWEAEEEARAAAKSKPRDSRPRWADGSLIQAVKIRNGVSHLSGTEAPPPPLSGVESMRRLLANLETY